MTNNELDIRDSITQAFDNIVNAAWEGAKKSHANGLTTVGCYALINEIQKEITNLKQILYTRAS